MNKQNNRSMTTFKGNLVARVEEEVRPSEGACGICHAVAEEICRAGGKILAYEQPKGILAHILDDKGDIV
jgi:hypothetical protein